jgi:hypothetical protein
MNIIIPIICCVDNIGEYVQLSNHIKETWGKQNREDSKIYYLWANNYEKKDDNDFVSNIKESYGALLSKFLDFLEYIQNWEYDYVFRVNCGSYVDVDNLKEFLENKPREKFYCGIRGRFEDIEFASGSGFIISKDLAKLTIENRNEFGVDHIDDISFGRFMQKNGISIDDTAIRVTWTGSGYIYQIGEAVIPENIFPLDKVYHWRLRSDDGNRYTSDCNKMKELYNAKIKNDINRNI